MIEYPDNDSLSSKQEKELIRKQIQEDIELFLKNGGTITQLHPEASGLEIKKERLREFTHSLKVVKQLGKDLTREEVEANRKQDRDRRRQEQKDRVQKLKEKSKNEEEEDEEDTEEED